MVSTGKFIKSLVPSFVIQQKLVKKGSIILTFDDGPHPEYTPRIMDLLDKYSARGLFFVPGCRVERAPELLREIVKRGHGIGNHSFSHLPCSRLRYSEIVDEIRSGADIIEKHCNVKTTLFRPPLGDVTFSLIPAAWKTGHRIFRWSIDSGEYSYLQGSSSEKMARHLLNGIHDRAIVLSHDDQKDVPKMLELVLPVLVDRGFDLRSGLTSVKWRRD